MAKLKITPEYPIEWFRFMRGPAAYVESSRIPDLQGVYSPWEAFVTGTVINLAFAAYEVHRWKGTFEKGTEWVYLSMIALLNTVFIWIISGWLGGRGRVRDMIAAFEYLYGFLFPTIALSMTLLMSLAELFPGLSCRSALDVIHFKSVPTKTNLAVITALQTIFAASAVYVIATFNLVIARIQQIRTWKVLLAQGISLAILAITGKLLYHLAGWVASRFKDIVEPIVG